MALNDTAPTATQHKTLTVKKQRAHLRINNRIKQQQIEPPV